MANHSFNGEQVDYKPYQRQTGFTYIGVLMAVALMGIGLLAISEVWTTTAKRQQLAQLDWIGDQYVQAIESYYYANTGSVHLYPQALEDLVEDKRYLFVKRHIRVLYNNPITQHQDWILVPALEGGIRGIKYRSADPTYAIEKQFLFVPVVNESAAPR